MLKARLALVPYVCLVVLMGGPVDADAPSERVCAGNTAPPDARPLHPWARAVWERVTRAARLHARVESSPAVSEYCLAPTGVYVSPRWLAPPTPNIGNDRVPALGALAYVLAVHHARFGRHHSKERDALISRRPDFVTGCTLARLGLRGAVLAEQVGTLLDRTTPEGEDAEAIRARRRAVIAQGVAACR